MAVLYRLYLKQNSFDEKDLYVRAFYSPRIFCKVQLVPMGDPEYEVHFIWILLMRPAKYRRSTYQGEGRIVKRFLINAESMSLNVADLSAGVYYLRTKAGTHQLMIMR